MLQWNSMHPYNAVHVARVHGSMDLDRLSRAVNRALVHREFSGLTLDADQGGMSPANGPAHCNITVIQPAGPLANTLAMEIERQLNTPFPLAGPFCPFRFFVAKDEGSFALGLAYLHAIADAESILGLMKEIVLGYASPAAPAPVAVRESSFSRPTNPLLSHPGAFARKLVALPRLIRNMGSSYRLSYRDAMDLRNGFRLFRMEPDMLQLLVASAKSWEVTVNDLLLALLMKSCALLTTGREKARRRRSISVGCIVNTRRDMPREEAESFGLHLGSFLLTHAVPAGLALRELATDVNRATLDIKRKKLYLATSLELSLGRLLLNFFPAERRKKLYQKHYPLCGGLTNMNINSLWPAHTDGTPADYLRGVSTGPVTPLVISFTTSGDAANLGLSYRSTFFTPGDIERFMGCFFECLRDLEVRS